MELNAFTSEQFIDWLNAKLVEHGAKKVIPDKEILEQAYRRAAAIRRYQHIIDDALEEVSAYGNDLTVPKALRAKVAKMLAKDPTLAWDDVLSVLIDNQEGSL